MPFLRFLLGIHPFCQSGQLPVLFLPLRIFERLPEILSECRSVLFEKQTQIKRVIMDWKHFSPKLYPFWEETFCAADIENERLISRVTVVLAI
jgi:hypothetical protein